METFYFRFTGETGSFWVGGWLCEWLIRVSVWQGIQWLSDKMSEFTLLFLIYAAY